MKDILYKYWYIIKDDNGFVTEAGVRLYEGGFQNVSVQQRDSSFADEERFVREKSLKRSDVAFMGDRASKFMKSGKEVFVFTSKDFGDFKDKDVLKLFLNREIAKDATRKPNKAQDEVESLSALKLKSA